MTRSEVPAKSVFTCDCCNEEVKTSVAEHRPTRWAKLTLYRDIEDLHGMPAACGNLELDLCSKCTLLVSNAINAAKEALHKATI